MALKIPKIIISPPLDFPKLLEKVLTALLDLNIVKNNQGQKFLNFNKTFVKRFLDLDT
jgi:hypothetical protein